MKKKQRFLRIGLALGALLVATGMSVWLYRPEPALIDISYAVGPIDTENQQWKWLSDKELLVLKSNTGPYAPRWQGYAERWNVIAGTHRQMLGLTNLLNRPEFLRFGKPQLGGLSPNRTWFTWIYEPQADARLPEAARLDGSHFYSLISEWGFFLDDRHWLEPGEGYYHPAFDVLDLQDWRKDRHYLPNAPQAKAIVARYLRLHPHFVCIDPWSHPDSLDISTYRTEDALSLVQSQQGEGWPREGAVPLQKGSVKLPPGAEMVMAQPSPQQETILYDLQIDHVNPVWVLLHRIVPKISAVPLRTESLWISKTDGSGFHEIGHVVVPQNYRRNIPTASNIGEFASVEWLPGGKQVAFVYRRILYLVPVK